MHPQQSDTPTQGSDLPQRVIVHVWGNLIDGFTGHIPNADITVSAATLEGAHAAAADAFHSRNKDKSNTTGGSQ